MAQPSTGIFELTALAAGGNRADNVLPIVNVHSATQAPQGSLVKLTLSELYQTATTAVTVSTPLPNITQTWNAGGVTFTAVKLNITDTASATASLLLDLQVGGVSKFSVTKGGIVVAPVVATKGKPWFDVTAYGALGDDTQDDTLLIQAAVTAAQAVAPTAGGANVYLPHGIYKTTDAIGYSTTANVNFIMSRGASIHPTTAGQIGITGSGNNASFTDFSVIGTVHGIGAVLSGTNIRMLGGTYSGASAVNVGAGSWCGGIFIPSCTGAVIDGVTCSGNGVVGNPNPGFDIQFGGNGATSTGWEVTRSSCTSTLVNANIIGFDSSYSVAIDNRCTGAVVDLAGDSGGYGISFYETTANPGSNIHNRVLQNQVTVTGGSGLYLQRQVGGVCANNVLVNTAATQTDVALPVGAIALLGCSRVSVTGNEILTSGKAGIVISDTAGTNSGVTVENNTIDGIANNPAIQLRGAANRLVIGGNTITNFQKCGVGNVDVGAAMPVLSHIVISKNTMTGARVVGTGTVSCASGSATFSVSQTGTIANTDKLLVAGVAYTVSAMAGSGLTCTLSGAPTFSAVAFILPKLTGTTSNGIRLFGAQDVKIEGNDIDNVCVQGIVCQDGSGGGSATAKITVAGNTVTDACGAGGAAYGILVNGTDCSVYGNHSHNGPLAQQYGGIQVVGTGTVAHHNNVRSVNTSDISVSGNAVGWGNFDSTNANQFRIDTTLSFSVATSKIIPGVTAFQITNNANTFANLNITDAGLVTIRAGLTLTAGALTFGAAASQVVPGATSLSLRNNANSADNFILTDAGSATLRANLTFAAAAAKIIPGATSLTFRNNADSADNLSIADAGAVAVRAGLTVGNTLSVTTGNLTLTAGNVVLPGGTNALLTSTASWNSGAGIATGTLTNAPSAGNPTMWLKFTNNGVNIFVPAWS